MTSDALPVQPAAGARMRVGVLGAGMIATIGYGYLPHLGKIRDRVELTAIADRRLDQARAVAEAHEIGRAVESLDDLLALDLDAVVNLLPGPAHFTASKRILEAGRHLVTEKPITGTLAEADELLDLADRRNLYVVAAPADMLASEWAQGARPHRPRRDSARSPSRGCSPPTPGLPGSRGRSIRRSSTRKASARSWTWRSTASRRSPACWVRRSGCRRCPGSRSPSDGSAAARSTGRPSRCRRPTTTCSSSTSVTRRSRWSTGPSTSWRPGARAWRCSGSRGRCSSTADDVGAPPVEVYRLEAAPGLAGWISPQTYEIFPVGSDRFAELQRGVADRAPRRLHPRWRPAVASGRHARHVLEIMLAAQQSAREGRVIDVVTAF